MSVSSLLNTTCTIRGPSFAANSTSGEPTATEADISTGVPCTVQAMRASESKEWARETGRVGVWVYLLPTATVRTQDRIVPDSGTYSGQVLSVEGPSMDQSGRANHLKVPCTLFVGGGGT